MDGEGDGKIRGGGLSSGEQSVSMDGTHCTRNSGNLKKAAYVYLRYLDHSRCVYLRLGGKGRSDWSCLVAVELFPL